MRVASICNNSKLCIEKGQFSKIGDPTESALKVAVEKLGRLSRSEPFDYRENPEYFSRNVLEPAHDRIATLEFSNDRKMMSVLVRNKEQMQQNVLYIKGAPERMIDACNAIQLGNGKTVPLNDDIRLAIVKQIDQFAAKGLRCLALGIKRDVKNLANITPDTIGNMLDDIESYRLIERDGTLVGFVGIKDPVRPEVPRALRDCKTAGISVIMITGDSKETAISIAKELGMANENGEVTCVTGAQLQTIKEEDLIAIIKRPGGKVFSRVEPSHKSKIVALLIEKTVRES